MLQDRLPVKFQDVKFKDPKFKHEIFMRIDLKHSYFSNYFIIYLLSIFSVVEIIIELFVVCQILIVNLSNFVLVHRNILMYDILACHLCRYASKNYSCGKFV